MNFWKVLVLFVFAILALGCSKPDSVGNDANNSGGSGTSSSSSSSNDELIGDDYNDGVEPGYEKAEELNEQMIEEKAFTQEAKDYIEQCIAGNDFEKRATIVPIVKNAYAFKYITKEEMVDYFKRARDKESKQTDVTFWDMMVTGAENSQ